MFKEKVGRTKWLIIAKAIFSASVQPIVMGLRLE